MEEGCDLERPPPAVYSSVRSEIVQRLLAQKCEQCGSEEGPFEVHHVRRLADLDRPGRRRATALGQADGLAPPQDTGRLLTDATRTSTGNAPEGVRGQGTGKPDEIERLTTGLGRGRRKSAEW